jgi:hypothetical protein
MGIFQRVGQAMYQNVQAQSEQQQAAADVAGGATASEDEVVEGEIVEEGGAS